MIIENWIKTDDGFENWITLNTSSEPWKNHPNLKVIGSVFFYVNLAFIQLFIPETVRNSMTHKID